VIPGDIGRELGVRAAGTWRPAPPGAGGAPGTYASSLPFLTAGASGEEPGDVAAALAARLRRVAWIAAASVTGGGYLTVTVIPEALAGLAVRVPTAGDACAASDALCGTGFVVPAAADPGSAATWAQAHEQVTAAITGGLAEAAGATVKRQRLPQQTPPPAQAAPAAAVAFAGTDAVRYALAQARPARSELADAKRWVRHDFSSPFFTVRYAHAHAASVLRWGADLGVNRGRPEAFRPELLAHPSELRFLDIMSWLPERVASAGRRRRPDAFTRYLESLGRAWLDCREDCPALPFGGRSAPRDAAGAAARLWLAAAAQTALGTGLRLLGVAAPERL
jgi:arginyl-tRNA synthetase